MSPGAGRRTDGTCRVKFWEISSISGCYSLEAGSNGSDALMLQVLYKVYAMALQSRHEYERNRESDTFPIEQLNSVFSIAYNVLQRVSWCAQCLSTPFDLRYLQLSTIHAGIHGTVSYRTVLIRRHWMLIRLDIN